METQRQKFGVPYDVKQRLMVYKIPGCQYCNHLETLFKRCSKPMIVDGIYYSILYINVGTGVSVDWFTSTYTNAPGYPWVVLADEQMFGAPLLHVSLLLTVNWRFGPE